MSDQSLQLLTRKTETRSDITHGRDHREQSLGSRFHPASDTLNDHSKTDCEALGLCFLMDREAKLLQLAINEKLVVGP